MKFVIDIDKTICSQEKDYKDAKPFPERIERFNKLYDEGHTIVYHTARGYETGIDWKDVTEQQFKDWGVKYHELLFGKPSADIYIDDKAVNVDSFSNIDKFVEKSWGYELWLKITDKYAMKKLVIFSGNSIHHQYHEVKEETWYINKGIGEAIINGEKMILHAGDVVHIPPKTTHKITAIEDVEIIETSTPELNDVIHLD